MRRKCSLRIPERMAERLTGVGAGDREYEQGLIADVCHDDLALARVPIPLERDRVISVLACVRFDEHDRLLSGSGHRTRVTSVRGVISTRGPRNPRVAWRPPKPPPTMTTRWALMTPPPRSEPAVVEMPGTAGRPQPHDAHRNRPPVRH